MALGILAYGSLIDDPGPEIFPHIIERIETLTPFNVEFKRSSGSRGNAPTLIPVEEGRRVRAIILVLDDVVDLQHARNILWRRELHIDDLNRVYRVPQNPTVNTVVIRELANFGGVETVLYTQIGQNLEEPVTPEVLAELAINSIGTPGGQNGNDGISYLLNAKNNGIVTELSGAYEQEILRLTNTNSLEAAINSFAHQ